MPFYTSTPVPAGSVSERINNDRSSPQPRPENVSLEGFRPVDGLCENSSVYNDKGRASPAAPLFTKYEFFKEDIKI